MFSNGDCLVFELKNGNYRGAVVLATDFDPETAYNLVATTRINQNTKPSIAEFERSEVLLCNFAEWKDDPRLSWYAPDLYYKNYSNLYEVIGKITVEIEYDARNYGSKEYLFKPSYTAGWKMNEDIQRQIDSEMTKAKPSKILTIRQLTKKDKWWKIL